MTIAESREFAISMAPGERIPLSFAQQRLWFLDQLEPGGTQYVIRVALRLTGPLDVMALERALSDLVARHQTLRTRFAADDSGRPYQIIDPPARVRLEVIDLAEDDVAAHLDQVAATSFDLARGPLLRTTLLRTAPAEAI